MSPEQQEILEQINEVSRGYHELSEKVASIMGKLDKIIKGRDKIAHTMEDSDREGTLFAQLVKFFTAVNNLPQTTGTIMRVTGISRSALAQILYRTHRDYFESEAMPGYSKKKLWKLRGAATQVAGLLDRDIGSQGRLFDD